MFIYIYIDLFFYWIYSVESLWIIYLTIDLGFEHWLRHIMFIFSEIIADGIFKYDGDKRKISKSRSKQFKDLEADLIEKVSTMQTRTELAFRTSAEWLKLFVGWSYDTL